MNLAAEIKEYLNLEKQIIKLADDVQNENALAFDIETESSIKRAVRLEQRLSLLDSKQNTHLNTVCEAFKITRDYFINCVNQYSEVSS